MPRCLAAVLTLLLLWPVALAAQDRIPSHCVALSEGVPGVDYIVPASFGDPMPADSVRLSYIAHATFVIETPGGIVAATDYTGFLGSRDVVPDVVTMNHAHATHWTDSPDPRIPHVLRGWDPEGGVAEHRLDLGEMLVRNVTTDIRSEWTGIEPDGNSIFVFEAAGLCIGHLGHLHHEPTARQYAMLGRMDVVLAPVDGGLTLDLPTMIRVLQRLRASVVIPMHWFGDGTLSAFLAGMSGDFAIMEPGDSSITLSLHGLPSRPTIVVLEPRYLR